MKKKFENIMTMTRKMPHVIRPMANSPFMVKEDAEMQRLRESIKEFGLFSPIVIREVPDDYKTVYEVISGNRRLQILNELNYSEIPVIIYSISDDEALIAMVDSNLCNREHILPSEKAVAYKLKLDAMKRQGHRTDLDEDLTCTQVEYKSEGEKSIQQLANESTDSREQIRRYIRLNELIPELLQMVDEEKIALTPAVELSYLTEKEQRDLLETIESEECTPSLSQAKQMKNLSQAKLLTMDEIFGIMRKPKSNQKEVIKIQVEKYDRYFAGLSTTKDKEDFIAKALDYYCKYLNRKKERDAR